MGKEPAYFERLITGLQQAAELSREEADPEAAVAHITRIARAVMGDLDAGMTTLRRLLVERGVEPGDATPRRRSARRPRAFDRRIEATPGAMPEGAPRRRGSRWVTAKSWEVIDGKRS